MMMFFHVEHDSAREKRSGRSRDSTRWSRISKGRRRSRAHMMVDCVRAARRRAPESAPRCAEQAKPSQRGSASLYRADERVSQHRHQVAFAINNLLA